MGMSFRGSRKGKGRLKKEHPELGSEWTGGGLEEGSSSSFIDRKTNPRRVRKTGGSRRRKGRLFGQVRRRGERKQYEGVDKRKANARSKKKQNEEMSWDHNPGAVKQRAKQKGKGAVKRTFT